MNTVKKITAIFAALLVLLASASSALAVPNKNMVKIGGKMNNKIEIISGPIERTIVLPTGETYNEKYYLIKRHCDPDEFAPIGVHLVKSEGAKPKVLMGMIAGTGLSFEANFMTHQGKPLAEYLADKGYMIVGIDAREINTAYNPGVNYGYMAAMGLRQHSEDVETAIRFAQEITDIENYELTGHSLGLYEAADYAATHSDDPHLKHVYGIDMPGPLDSFLEPEMVQLQQNYYNTYQEKLAAGETVNLEMFKFAQMIFLAKNDPNGDSGTPNPFALNANLTNYELAIMALIYTNQLPGNEIYIQGFLAGDMVNGLYYTPIETIFASTAQGGIYPTAVDRDMAGIFANIPGSYQIRWQNIKVDFDWWNMEKGMGYRPQAVNIMREAGNINANFHLKTGYAHADAVFASNAEPELWNYMFQQQI